VAGDRAGITQQVVPLGRPRPGVMDQQGNTIRAAPVGDDPDVASVSKDDDVPGLPLHQVGDIPRYDFCGQGQSVAFKENIQICCPPEINIGVRVFARGSSSGVIPDVLVHHVFQVIAGLSECPLDQVSAGSPPLRGVAALIVAGVVERVPGNLLPRPVTFESLYRQSESTPTVVPYPTSARPKEWHWASRPDW